MGVDFLPKISEILIRYMIDSIAKERKENYWSNLDFFECLGH